MLRIRQYKNKGVQNRNVIPKIKILKRFLGAWYVTSCNRILQVAGSCTTWAYE